MYLNALYRVLFVLSVITIQFSETAIRKRLFQKMDDLEFEMRKENLQRHKEIRELRHIVNRMEEQMNNSMTILDRRNSEISDTDSQSHQVKTEQLDSRKIAEVLRTFKILKRGFSEEKKVTSRLRRHVTKMQSEIVDQQNVSRELSKGVTNILEAVTTVSDILNDIKNENTGIKEKVKILYSTSNQRFSRIEETLNKIHPQLSDLRNVPMELSKGVANIREELTPVSDMFNDVKNAITDIKERGIIMTSEISTSNQICSRIDELLTTEITGSLDVLKMTGQKVEVFHNETQMFGCSKDDIKELQNQLIYKCVRAYYTSCKKFLEAGCMLSDVYKLSLETGAEQVNTRISHMV